MCNMRICLVCIWLRVLWHFNLANRKINSDSDSNICFFYRMTQFVTCLAVLSVMPLARNMSMPHATYSSSKKLTWLWHKRSKLGIWLGCKYSLWQNGFYLISRVMACWQIRSTVSYSGPCETTFIYLIWYRFNGYVHTKLTIDNCICI